MCEVDWVLVADLSKVIGPAIIAGVVAWVAYQQWITAKNKLALDLFDRRYKTVHNIRENIQKLKKELPRNLEEPIKILGPASEAKAILNVEIDQAKFLFGSGIAELWKELVKETERGRDAIATALVKFPPEEQPTENYLKIAMVSRDRVGELEKHINDLVEPFMMMDSIGVNRPKVARK